MNDELAQRAAFRRAYLAVCRARMTEPVLVFKDGMFSTVFKSWLQRHGASSLTDVYPDIDPVYLRRLEEEARNPRYVEFDIGAQAIADELGVRWNVGFRV